MTHVIIAVILWLLVGLEAPLVEAPAMGWQMVFWGGFVTLLADAGALLVAVADRMENVVATGSVNIGWHPNPPVQNQ